MNTNTGANLKKKEPLLRIVKRPERSRNMALLLKLFSVLAALLAGGLFILAVGHSPIEIYKTIILGSMHNSEAIKATVRLTIPLVINALGVSLAFRMRFWNIGAEGQMIMGAIFATYFALFHNNWPHWLLLIVMFLAGAVGGGLWGLIPAFFKSKFNTNETLFTLMLNYIALYFIVFLRDGPWADPESGGFPKIARFDKNAQLDKVFGVNAGWIIALVLVAVLFIYYRYTKQGYEINVVGASKATAKYAGMKVKKIILRTMLLSGAICGIAGMIQATGSDMTLTESVAGGIGFTAIIVAWLANLNPLGILLTSFLFSMLDKGSSVMESTFGLSADASAVLQGIILFFVLGGEFFIRYHFAVRKREKDESVPPAEAAKEVGAE